MQEPTHEQSPLPLLSPSLKKKPRRKAASLLTKGLVICLGLLLVVWMLYRTGWVREIMVSRLAAIGEPSVPLLRRALQDEDHRVRGAARNGLLSLKPEQAVPSLTESLRDLDPPIRTQACAALQLYGKEAADATPILIRLLRDQNAEVRTEAARAIAAIGASAQDAIPDLIAMTRDASSALRAEALDALGNIGWRQSDLVMPVLVKCLADSNAEVRAEAAEALGVFARQGANVEMAKTALQQASQDPDRRVRREATEALNNAARPLRVKR